LQPFGFARCRAGRGTGILSISVPSGRSRLPFWLPPPPLPPSVRRDFLGRAGDECRQGNFEADLLAGIDNLRGVFDRDNAACAALFAVLRPFPDGGPRDSAKFRDSAIPAQC